MVTLELAKTFAQLITKIAAMHGFSDEDAKILQNVMNQHIREGGGGTGGGGTGNYPDLDNKPTMNGVTIQGNMSPGSLGLASSANLDSHITNASVHTTSAEKLIWNNKVERVAAALGELFVTVNNIDAKNPEISSTILLQQGIERANTAIQQSALEAAIAAHSASVGAHGDIRHEVDEIITTISVTMAGHNTDPTAHQDIRNMVNNLDFVKSVENVAGILTFTFKDNSTLAVNLIAESLDVDIDYDPATKNIILKKSDGSEIGRVNVSDLVDTYLESNGAHIQITIGTDNSINAVLKAGTVTKAELHTDLVAELEGKLNKNLGIEKAGQILTVGLDGEIITEETIEMTAENVSYDNTESGLEAQNVQEALDELNEKIETKTVEVDGITIIGDGNETPLEVQISEEPKNAVEKKADGLFVLDKVAADVPYDNTESELLSDNVQAAIDETNLVLNDLANDLATLTDEFDKHVENLDIHVTAEDKLKWNTTSEEFDQHKANDDIHVTLQDKTNWNNKVDKTNGSNKIYGTDESGEQVAYDKDNFVSKDVWLPSVDTNGNITFVRDSTETPPQSANIKGVKGDDGVDGFTFVPDWINEEDGSRISTDGGTWNVLRDGFIHVTGSFNVSAGRLSVQINSRDHYFIIPQAGWTDSRIFPVAAGDSVRIISTHNTSNLSAIRCYFIPARFITPQP